MPPAAEPPKLAILDRDGTIVDVVRDEETGAVTVAFHPDQLRLLPGALEGMRALQEGGYLLAIATNQPAPAKGQFSADAVRRTNEALVARLTSANIHIAAVEVCMHHPDGGPGGDPALVVDCGCRKPKPGMLDALIERLGADRAASWMIGDGRGDAEAGRAAGLHTGLVFAPNRCELCPLRDGPRAVGGERGASSAKADALLANAVPLVDVHGATLWELASAILRHRQGPRAI